MEYVRFGTTGLRISRLILGCMSYGSKQWRPWVLDEAESRPFIQRSLELGINFFDTADMYSAGASEEVLGRALRDFGPARDKVVIASKVFYPMGDGPNDKGLSRKRIFDSCDATLRRLGTDYLDLYQIHRFDPDTSIEEVLIALNDLVRAGKVRYIGSSAMWAWQFMKMLGVSERLALAKFVSMQDYYNVVYREEEREMHPLCTSEGIAVIPFSPLARGFVVGNRRKEDLGETVRAKTDEFSRRQYYGDQDFAIVDRITQIAHARGVNNAQIALAWVMNQRAVTAPIIGATKMYQLDDAMAALSIKLTPEELKLLAEHYRPKTIIGHV
jgi:aryl-alcohol dehydrogenase (NADP+)